MKNIYAVILILVFACSAQGQELFSDDFSGGPDSSWIVPNSGWEWNSGQFHNVSSCGFQGCMSPLFIGCPDWTNTTLKLDFTPTSGGVIYLMVGMSAPSLFAVGGSSGFLLDMGWNDHAHIAHFPTGEVIAEDWSGLWHLDVGVTYTVEFGVDQASAFARFYPAGSPAPDWQLFATHSFPTNGWCGFSTWHTLGGLDNVVVSGVGSVATEELSFGAVKALFR